MIQKCPLSLELNEQKQIEITFWTCGAACNGPEHSHVQCTMLTCDGLDFPSSIANHPPACQRYHARRQAD